MPNVYKLERRKFPTGAAPCLERLTAHAKAGAILGVAFVCLMDGDTFIADTCGTASTDLDKTRHLLRALDAKIAKRQLAARK